jgi:hypothetical protein
MVLILRIRSVEKSILEISRFNLSTDFGGVLKTLFGELKKRFMTTAPFHILWYIRIIFDSLEVSKCVFNWNMNYIRVPSICFKSYHHPNFYQITRLKSVTNRSFVWCINMVLILRTQTSVKSLLKISRFNLSKDFSGLLKMHFVELKMGFFPTAPIHIVCYIRNYFYCLEVIKCVFIWNMI